MNPSKRREHFGAARGESISQGCAVLVVGTGRKRSVSCRALLYSLSLLTYLVVGSLDAEAVVYFPCSAMQS